MKINTDDNQDYVGQYPHKMYYGYEEMKKADRERFDLNGMQRQKAKRLISYYKCTSTARVMLIF